MRCKYTIRLHIPSNHGTSTSTRISLLFLWLVSCFCFTFVFAYVFNFDFWCLFYFWCLFINFHFPLFTFHFLFWLSRDKFGSQEERLSSSHHSIILAPCHAVPCRAMQCHHYHALIDESVAPSMFVNDLFPTRKYPCFLLLSPLFLPLCLS